MGRSRRAVGEHRGNRHRPARSLDPWRSRDQRNVPSLPSGLDPRGMGRSGAAHRAAGRRPMSAVLQHRSRLYGVDVDALTMDETVDRIMELLSGRDPVQHVVLNASKVVAMSKDPALKHVISTCAVINADGMSVVVASRLLRQALPERVAGIDLFERLVARGAGDGRSVYFLGARDEVLSELVRRFRARYPSLR